MYDKCLLLRGVYANLEAFAVHRYVMCCSCVFILGSIIYLKKRNIILVIALYVFILLGINAHICATVRCVTTLSIH